MKQFPPSLYGITAELSALEALLEDSEAPIELNPVVIAGLIEQIQDKTDAVVGFQKYLEDQVLAIDNRVKELADYKRAVVAKMDRLDTYVASCLKQLGTSKIEGKLATIKRRAPVDVVVITSENDLPMEFLRTKVEPEKTKIKAALKAGIEVPGATIEKSQSISMSYENRKPLSRKEANE